MNRWLAVSLALCLAATSAWAGRQRYTYTTTFPADEYPISEGGRWVNNNPAAGSPLFGFARMETFGGRAFSKKGGASGTNDSFAHLTGFPPDQFIEGTFYMDGTYTWPNASEGTLMVRATSSPTAPYIETYGLYYGVWGGPGTYNGNMGIGLWDGTPSQNQDPNTFYGRLTNQFSGPAACLNGPRSGDVLRLTVTGQSPPTLNAYIKRAGQSTFTHCLPFDVQDFGASSIVSLPTYGPSWHTPFLTGNPGISGFEPDAISERKQGWAAITAGPWP